MSIDGFLFMSLCVCACVYVCNYACGGVRVSVCVHAHVFACALTLLLVWPCLWCPKLQSRVLLNYSMSLFIEARHLRQTQFLIVVWLPFALRNLCFSLLKSGKTKSCYTCLAFPECVNLHAGRHVCMAKSVSLTHISNPLLKALKQFVICSHL